MLFVYVIIYKQTITKGFKMKTSLSYEVRQNQQMQLTFKILDNAFGDKISAIELLENDLPIAYAHDMETLFKAFEKFKRSLIKRQMKFGQIKMFIINGDEEPINITNNIHSAKYLINKIIEIKPFKEIY